MLKKVIFINDFLKNNSVIPVFFGLRSKVFKLGKNWVLKTPVTYQAAIQKRGSLFPLILPAKVDYLEAIKPGFDLARQKLSDIIPEMLEINDLRYSTEECSDNYEKWGYIQKYIPRIFGDELLKFHLNGEAKKIKKLINGYVEYQYTMWDRGVWDSDTNPLKNYAILDNGNFQLIDIDSISVTNDHKRYPYNPKFYLLKRFKHYSKSYNDIARIYYPSIYEKLSREIFESKFRD
jgi:hypothetical protein